MMPSKMRVIERQKGIPLKDILVESFARNGSQSAVARELGVTQTTISWWLNRLHLRQKVILVKDKTNS
jgi:DNA invertase Pin-like site-specific DNA recombinase